MTRIIRLTKGLSTVVDDRWFEFLSAAKWMAVECGKKIYAKSNLDRGEYLHRLILDLHKDVQVDHINGDGLDNRVSNLRIATAHQNRCNRGLQTNNTSGYKGVSFHKQSGLWHALIKTNGRVHSLKYHPTPEAAARAYNAAAPRFHGEFACLNQIPQGAK